MVWQCIRIEILLLQVALYKTHYLCVCGHTCGCIILCRFYVALAGEVIISQEPYVSVPNNSAVHSRCEGCFRSSNLKKCSACHVVWYCGSTCQVHNRIHHSSSSSIVIASISIFSCNSDGLTPSSLWLHLSLVPNVLLHNAQVIC